MLFHVAVHVELALGRVFALAAAKFDLGHRDKSG
jgi:hypothetical protein